MCHYLTQFYSFKSEKPPQKLPHRFKNVLNHPLREMPSFLQENVELGVSLVAWLAGRPVPLAVTGLENKGKSQPSPPGLSITNGLFLANSIGSGPIFFFFLSFLIF